MNKQARVIVAIAAAAVLIITTISGVVFLAGGDDDTTTDAIGNEAPAADGPCTKNLVSVEDAQPTADGEIGDDGLDGVEVNSDFGDKPTVELPGKDGPDALKAKVLTAGDGKEVLSGELLVAHYLGTCWTEDGGEANEDTIFDNSYDRGAPSAFPIGVGSVIPAWDRGLVGKNVGDRVLVYAPAGDAYGGAGDAGDGAQLAGQNLVFVVDIVDSISKDVAADGTPVTDLPDGLPEVDSQPGKAPKLVDATKAEGVEANKVVQLLKGDGAEIEAGQAVVIQTLQSAAQAQEVQSSWDSTGPGSVQFEAILQSIPEVEGATVGSRYLMVLPNPEDTNDPMILVVDFIAAY